MRFWWYSILIRRYATRDAKAGSSDPEAQVERYITALLGPRPAFDPVGNLRDGHVADGLSVKPALEEVEDDYRGRRVEQTRDTSRATLLVQVGIFFAAEVLAATYVMRDLGYAPPERNILALMLASFLVWITEFCARTGGTHA